MKPLLVTLMTFCLMLSAIVGLSAQTSSRLDDHLIVAIDLRDRDVRELLNFVCKKAKMELDMPQDLKATVTVDRTSDPQKMWLLVPTLREALDAITQPAGLAYSIDAGKLKVTRR